MPKTKISEYSTTNTDNSDIESINIAEGCAPSGINNAIRELMVHLKEFQTGSSGDPLTVAGAFVASGGTTANTMSVTGILTASGGTVLSGTNTISGSAVISGNINSSGTTNTFSGGNVLSGTNTLSGTTIISGNATISGTTNTISGAAIISGNINSSGSNTFSGAQIISGNINSSGSSNTFSGGVVHSGTNTFSGSTIISGNINSSGTNTFSGSQIISGSINSSGSTNTFSGNTIFSVNSSSDAVRITQTGAGNALVVEDSTNPDATPFVVDASGVVGVRISPPALAGSTGLFTNSDISMGGGSRGILGNIYYQTAWKYVDNGYGWGIFDSNGSLTFNLAPLNSSGAGAAATVTEWMRLGNTGNVGIGATAAASDKLRIGGTLPSTGASTYAVRQNGTFPQASTSNAVSFLATANTEDAAVTFSAIYGYYAQQGTITGGSRLTPTNQYGFYIDASLTGATNNYGFYSNIASGTGRWNFYANGTANNYFAGAVGIGATSLTGYNFRISRALTGLVDSSSVAQYLTINSDVTTAATLFDTFPSTQAASFTLTTLNHYRATQSTIGATSAVTNQYGFNAGASLTGATNNFGFYSNIASGSNRWNFYANGTAANYFGGHIYQGNSTQNATRNVRLGATITGGTVAYNVLCDGVVQTDVTSNAHGIAVVHGTAASASITNLYQFYANQGTFGAGTTVTAQVGYFVDSSLTGATSNYGFYGNIASGSNRWNLYMNGTARNYLAGGLEVVAGTTSMTAGFTHVPSAAGAPTGAPTNPTGNVPLYYDTTNNKLYVYNGAWKSVSLT